MTVAELPPDEGPPDEAAPDEAAPGERLTEPLPEPVRQRVLALAADALGELPAEEVPAALRRVARFAPAKRARHAGVPLATALESDPVFRHRVTDLVGRALPGLVTAVRAGEVPPAADPVDVAAVAYLDRPSGWTAVVRAAGEAAATAQVTARRADDLDRLEAHLATTRTAAKEERERLRAEISRVKEENTALRRRVQELRLRARAAESAAAEAQAAVAAATEADRAARASSDAELRRLRGRLAELEGRADAARRTDREGRSATSTSQRLLLDTILEAAQGLRRELALPPVTARPADAVPARAPGTGDAVSARALEDGDPEALDAVLALPGLHLVIDGYNVTRQAWDPLPLETQRTRLVSALGGLVARTRAEVTCVFDGADLASTPPVNAPRGVRVLFSPAGTTADEVVRRIVAAEPEGRPVLVVSSDREVVDGVRRSGARTVGSAAFLRRVSAR